MFKEELDFKDLLKNPIRLFGYSYFYFFVIILAIGIYFVNNLGIIAKGNVPFSIADTTEVQNDLQMLQPINIPPVEIKKVSAPNVEMIKSGKNLYSTNCASCHGESGLGDGPSGLVMNPKPRNLTDSSGWINGRKISEMYKTLEEGMLKSGMLSFNHLPAEDRFAMIHYIRTFGKNPPQDSPEELEALNVTYKLLEGKKSSAQIPITLAMKKLIEESSNRPNFGKDISNLLNEEFSSDEPARQVQLYEAGGLMIVNKFSNGKEKVLNSLSAMSEKSLSESDFISIISAAPNQYGFKTKVINATQEEWNLLFKLMTKLKLAKRE